MPEHIMLSYQRNSTDLVSKVFDYLTKNQSTPVWMDQYGGIQEHLSERLEYTYLIYYNFRVF